MPSSAYTTRRAPCQPRVSDSCGTPVVFPLSSVPLDILRRKVAWMAGEGRGATTGTSALPVGSVDYVDNPDDLAPKITLCNCS